MRGKPATKRKIKPDYKYNNLILSKMVNQVMRGGKKTVAEGIIYDCLDLIAQKSKQEPLSVFERAINNVSPVLEVKSRRIGGANYQIPVEVRGDRRLALALRWIIGAARSKKGRRMSMKLASELMEAAEMRGDAIKKKQDVQKMAESNRAFAHFA